MHRLRKPYLLFLGDVQDELTAKTAFGLKDWCTEDVLGEYSLCHDPSRRTIDEYPDFPIPDLRMVIADYLRAGRLTNPAVRCVGLSINSSRLSEAAGEAYFTGLRGELGLPVCDPMRTGVEVLTDALLA